ncbi:MAG: VOC family protein [Candidatus Latescibacteria bacterium]|nr:VOC family protein [Candidatus Latescibacterota bacterium]
MQLEHVAVIVADAEAVADWYCRHLQMRVVRQGPAPARMHFLADSSGRVVLEIYHMPADQVPDYGAMHPLVLHLAFATGDAAGTHQRLVEAGATALGGVGANDTGDVMAMLRDPWGLAIQLCQRLEPMA